MDRSPADRGAARLGALSLASCTALVCYCCSGCLLSLSWTKQTQCDRALAGRGTLPPPPPQQQQQRLIERAAACKSRTGPRLKVCFKRRDSSGRQSQSLVAVSARGMRIRSLARKQQVSPSELAAGLRASTLTPPRSSNRQRQLARRCKALERKSRATWVGGARERRACSRAANQSHATRSWRSWPDSTMHTDPSHSSSTCTDRPTCCTEEAT